MFPLLVQQQHSWTPYRLSFSFSCFLAWLCYGRATNTGMTICRLAVKPLIAPTSLFGAFDGLLHTTSSMDEVINDQFMSFLAVLDDDTLLHLLRPHHEATDDSA